MTITKANFILTVSKSDFIEAKKQKRVVDKRKKELEESLEACTRCQARLAEVIRLYKMDNKP